MILTEDEYVQINGVECPICQSADLDTSYYPKTYGIQLKQTVDCNDCGATWVDVYNLSGYEDLQE